MRPTGVPIIQLGQWPFHGPSCVSLRVLKPLSSPFPVLRSPIPSTVSVCEPCLLAVPVSKPFRSPIWWWYPHISWGWTQMWTQYLFFYICMSFSAEKFPFPLSFKLFIEIVFYFNSHTYKSQGLLFIPCPYICVGAWVPVFICFCFMNAASAYLPNINIDFLKFISASFIFIDYFL